MEASVWFSISMVLFQQKNITYPMLQSILL